jgi:hypothetical protein
VQWESDQVSLHTNVVAVGCYCLVCPLELRFGSKHTRGLQRHRSCMCWVVWRDLCVYLGGGAEKKQVYFEYAKVQWESDQP